MRLNGNLVLNTGGQSEIQNAVIERLSAAPAATSAERGRIYFNTSDNKYYYNDGTTWVSIATGGNAAALQNELDAVEAAIGAAVTSAGVFAANAFNGASYISSPTSITNAIMQLDAGITGKNQLSELLDVAFGTLSDKDVIYYNSAAAKWENAASGATSGVQAWDADLDAVAALAGTGIAVRTAANTWATRTLVAPAAGVTITNPDGVAGNVTVALANDLAAVEGIATYGFGVRTADDTWTTRSVTTGSSSRITVGNGDGVAGNVLLDLATVTDSGAGTFKKITVDAYGRVSGTTPVVQSDITGLVDTVYVNTAGDTMTGNLIMSAGTYITIPDAPTAGTDAVNKTYVDAQLAGLTWKNAVRVMSDAPITLSGTQTIDNQALVAGDRVLVAGQGGSITVGHKDNGVYVVAAGAWTRSSDMDQTTPLNEFNSAAVFVEFGTNHGNTGWTQIDNVSAIGTDPVQWTQFNGAAGVTAGVGLQKSGNTLSVQLGAGIAELPTAEVGVDLYNVSSNSIILTLDGATRSTDSNAQLALLLSGSTLTQGVAGLKVAAGGITSVELAASVAGAGLSGGAGTALAVNVDGSTIEINSDTLRVKAGGITNNEIANATIANAKLVNSSITLSDGVDTSVQALGSTVQFAGTNGLTPTVSAGTVSYALTGNLSNLSDVAVASPTSGDQLVYNGTKFVNRKTYFLYSGASSTVHTVIHNLGQKYTNVTVVDAATDEVVIPQSIVFDSANQLTVTFNSALAAKVVVMGV